MVVQIVGLLYENGLASRASSDHTDGSSLTPGLSPVYQGVRIESPFPELHLRCQAYPSNAGAWVVPVPQELGSQLSCSGNTSDRDRGGSMWWLSLASNQVSLYC